MKHTTDEHSCPGRTPFDNIALAFSGGGFRAATFGLGVLSYLHHLSGEDGRPLLENVTFISSASGGSIPNAMYALYNAQGKSFGHFYRDLFSNLEGTGLVDRILSILNQDKEWEEHPEKRRNMINAFALGYDKYLFQSAVLGDLCLANSSSHLEEVCFNATEFYRGLLFRQNVKMKHDNKGESDTKFRFGNFGLYIDELTAKRLKLADLLAASSCFPAGFEPIVFPDDFTYNTRTQVTDRPALDNTTLLKGIQVQLRKLDKQELKRLYGEPTFNKIAATLPDLPALEAIQKAFKDLPVCPDFKIGMMDGGIADNQALESITDAQKRRLSGKTDFTPFDLMLINDVDKDFMDPYLPADNHISYTGIKGVSIYAGMVLMCLFCIAGTWLIALGYSGLLENPYHGFSFIAGTALFLLGGTVLAILFTLRRYIKANIRKIGGLNLDNTFSKAIVTKLFYRFGSTPVAVLFRMLKERISSVLILNTDIFLKRISYLLYKDTRLNPMLRYTLQTNRVYTLAFSNDYTRISENWPAYMHPTRDMQKIAQCATEMGTTLWFDTANQDKGKLFSMIACGQFTTCHNLLAYIHSLKTQRAEKQNHTCYELLTEEYRQKVDYLEQQLRKDFEKFRENPFWLYNYCGHHFKVNNFREYRFNPKDYEMEHFEQLR